MPNPRNPGAGGDDDTSSDTDAASPHRGRGDAWGIGALLVLCLALAGCQRGRITEPGGKPPCFAWVVDTTITVTVVGYPGATAYVKRCVVGGGR